jgi:hypothetical protein
VDALLRDLDDLPKPVLIQCAQEAYSSIVGLLNVASEEGLNADQAMTRAEEMGVDVRSSPKLEDFVRRYADAHASVGHASG